MSKLMRMRVGEDAHPHIFIATTSYTGQVGSSYLSSLLGSAGLLSFEYLLLGGNCHVDDARNAVVREFLQTECEQLVFIDADVGWRPDELKRLIEHAPDLVAGVYPKRGESEDYPVWSIPGEIWSDASGLVEVEGAPTGFMKIRRHVLEKLVDANKHRQFQGQNGKPDDPPYTIIFERTYEDGHRWSGDYAFCRKWRSLGGKVYVDPEMTFAHEGTHEWAGCLGDFWRRRAGLIHPELTKTIARLAEGEATAAVFGHMVEQWGNKFSVTPEFLAAAYKLALNARGPILECGSGLSTIVIGVAAKKNEVPVFSLEHDLSYLDQTQKFVLNGHQKIIYAPIVRHGDKLWYQVPDGLPDSFCLVICDGPPRRYGREGLFSLLGDRIAKANILMDDADDERQVEMLVGRNNHILGRIRPFAISTPQ